MKTSAEWYKEWQLKKGLIIIDPDGWDRGGNYTELWYNTPMTEAEFSARVSESTIIVCNPTINEEVNKDEFK